MDNEPGSYTCKQVKNSVETPLGKLALKSKTTKDTAIDVKV